MSVEIDGAKWREACEGCSDGGGGRFLRRGVAMRGFARWAFWVWSGGRRVPRAAGGRVLLYA